MHNVTSEADDLPLFSKERLSGLDSHFPTVSDQVTVRSDQVSDQVTPQINYQRW